MLPELLQTQLKAPALRRFAERLAPLAPEVLEQMARASAALTRRHFGKAIRLFAPLYVSNECINSCTYCGFSRENAILRTTLNLESVLKEGRYLAAEGFRNVLLVAGEHPKFVSSGYLESCVRQLAPEIPSLSLEVAPMDTEEYATMVHAGAEGLVVYQETYDEATYADLHTAGPKKNFAWRLACPERAYAAGFRRIGIGALFGLRTDWREEALALAAHLAYLHQHGWKAQWTVSLPRIRPCAGGFAPRVTLSDAEYVQLVCAFRLTFPQVGIVLSTREPAAFRDGLVPLGVTMMSAGSHTEPGGYTGQGRDTLHRTTRHHLTPIDSTESVREATRQFDIADERSPREVAGSLRALGLDPVWKDWDRAILTKT